MENKVIKMSFYESGTISSFIAQVQPQHRVVIPKSHLDILGIKDGDYLDVSVRKLKPNRKK